MLITSLWRYARAHRGCEPVAMWQCARGHLECKDVLVPAPRQARLSDGFAHSAIDRIVIVDVTEALTRLVDLLVLQYQKLTYRYRCVWRTFEYPMGHLSLPVRPA